MDLTMTFGSDLWTPPLSSTGGPLRVALGSRQPSVAGGTPGPRADELDCAMDAVLSLRRRAVADHLPTDLIDRMLSGLTAASKALRGGDTPCAKERLIEALGTLGDARDES